MGRREKVEMVLGVFLSGDTIMECSLTVQDCAQKNRHTDFFLKTEATNETEIGKIQRKGEYKKGEGNFMRVLSVCGSREGRKQIFSLP